MAGLDEGIISHAQAARQLHVLDLPDEVCTARLRKSDRSGECAHSVHDKALDPRSRHFGPPWPEEGFDVIVHRYRGPVD